MKSAAAIGATAAIAAVALSTQTEETQLFHNENLTSADYEFMRYVSQYGKSYGTKAEFKFRAAQFKQSLEKIASHSENATHTIGINQFADWTPTEMKKLLGYRSEMRQGYKAAAPLDTENLADSKNWVDAGAVTPVKNQGQCGSCWAFSTTGSIEGAEFLATGTLTSLSEQQLVDCAGSYGNYGCNGGLMDNAFQYVEKNPLETESSYPYTARDGTCSYDSSKGVGKVAGYQDVTPNSAAQLKAALGKGPVSVAIEADTYVFQMYTGGVITSSSCGTQLDHGVLAVGYGSENGQEYFLVKNSWGASWGASGYVKIGASDSNICGILSAASYPTES
jgi:cathepsin L